MLPNPLYVIICVVYSADVSILRVLLSIFVRKVSFLIKSVLLYNFVTGRISYSFRDHHTNS